MYTSLELNSVIKKKKERKSILREYYDVMYPNSIISNIFSLYEYQKLVQNQIQQNILHLVVIAFILF